MNPNPWAGSDHDPTSTQPQTGVDDLDDLYADWNLEIEHRRGQLTAALNNALTALTAAAAAAAALCSDHVYDVEFAEEPAGEDITALLAGALRRTRAAYAITHHITDRS